MYKIIILLIQWVKYSVFLKFISPVFLFHVATRKLKIARATHILIPLKRAGLECFSNCASTFPADRRPR